MALAVEGVNFVFIWVEEAFLREVFGVTIKFKCVWTFRALDLYAKVILFGSLFDAFSLSFLNVPDEVVVHLAVVVEEVDVDEHVSHEAADNIGVLEVFISHCVIVNPKQLVNVQLVFLDLSVFPLLLAKGAQPEAPVIKVHASVVVAFGILFHLFNFDVIVLSSSNFFFETLKVWWC